MGTGLRSSQLLTALLLSSAFVAGAGAVGCRTTESDVHRWGETQNGPKRLEAVITHDKYTDALRTEAALTLVRMKARSGKRIGLEGSDDPEQRGLLAVLTGMPKEVRAKLIGSMTPALEAGMKSPPADRTIHRADESYPYKDAAFAILTHDKGSLISIEDVRRRLQDGIAEWVATDFAGRMEESTQVYSMDQVLRYLGARGVARLPELMKVDAPKLDRMSEFVAEFGDIPTRLSASEKLVAIANHVSSAKWLAERDPVLKKANQESKLNPTPAQFKAQLDAYQEEELVRLFSSMKKVGGKPVISFLSGFALDTANSEKRRLSAIAALEGNVDRNDTKLVDNLFTLATAEATPDTVRDLVLRRLGELPRKLVIGRLYALFANTNWKVRFGAADLALRISESQDVPEYMTKLGAIKTMAMAEPLAYGGTLNEVKGAEKPEALAGKFVTPEYPAPVRLTALGWYFRYGPATSLEIVKRYQDDKTKVIGCAKDAKDCEWKCEIAVGDKSEAKDITTVGEFVRYCVMPEMEKRGTAEIAKK
jgi:hypothetical protein